MNAIKKLKGYGKLSRVCYKDRRNIGAARVAFGKCLVCGKQTNTGNGALPSICDNCSVELNKCKYCLVELE